NSFREFSTVRRRKEQLAERVDYTQAQAARLLYEEARDATTLSFCPVLWTGRDRAVGPRRSGAGAVSSRHQQGADVARRTPGPRRPPGGGRAGIARWGPGAPRHEPPA